MGILIKLLVLMAGLGIAAKLGAFNALERSIRNAGMQTGFSTEQTAAVVDWQNWLSIGNILEIIGNIPPPFGIISQVLFILILTIIIVSVLIKCMVYFFAFLRWIREALT